MGKNIAQLAILLSANTAQITTAFGGVEKQVAKLSSSFEKFGKEMSLKVTAPITAIGLLSLSLADTQMKAEAKVQRAIKDTVGAKMYSLENLKSYASELQDISIFDDGDILNDVTSKMVTFTNITESGLKRAQLAVVNLATKFDSDLSSEALKLGKALNNPIENLSQLSRKGLEFSESQIKVITALVETNRLAEAQNIIFEEVDRIAGGQAKAVATAGLDSLRQLKNNWEDILKDVGKTIMPFINNILLVFNDLLVFFKNLSPEVKGAIILIAGVAAAIGPIALAIGGVIQLLPLLAAGFAALLSPVGLVVAALVALGSAFAFTYVKKMQFKLEINNDDIEALEKKLSNNLSKQYSVNNYLKFDDKGNNLSKGYSKNKIIGELIEEERAIKKVLEAKKEAQEIQDKLKKEAQETQDKLNKELEKIKNFGGKTVVSVGKINELSSAISDLEAKRPFLQDEMDIATLNEQIDVLKSKLDGLYNLKPWQLLSSEPIASSEGMDFKKTDVVSPLIESFLPDPREVEEVAQNMGDKLAERAEQFRQDINRVIRDGVINATVSSAEIIGDLITGDLGLEGGLAKIGGLIGSFLKSLGTMLISYGTTMDAFKKAVASIIEAPWIAIGLGIAMVITGTIMQNALANKAKKEAPKLAKGGLAFGPTYAMVGDNPNASIDPEVISPLSKLKGMLGSANSQIIEIRGKLVAEGKDLVIALDNNAHFKRILG